MASPVLVYDDKYLKYNFGDEHAMREERLLLTRMLMHESGLIGPRAAVEMKPVPSEYEDLIAVHDREYLEVLEHLSEHPDGQSFSHGLGTSDNPVFAGMFEAANLQVGGTVLACELVAKGETDRALNMGGGFHHAMPARASGFCLLNDIAVGIKHMLGKHGMNRVMYVDIDVHHADGVQSIFLEEPRVLKVSLHEDGHYLFPGTGYIDEIGKGEGEGYTVNIPLPPYSGDKSYLYAFKEIVIPLAESYKPDVLFTQLGADAHFADPLAHLKLTTRAYEEVGKDFDRISRACSGGRWVAVTGGGYDIMICPRIWTLFFAKMIGKELPDALPIEWMEYCKITYANAPKGGMLRDPEEPLDDDNVSSAAKKTVDGVKKKVFGFHGLS